MSPNSYSVDVDITAVDMMEIKTKKIKKKIIFMTTVLPKLSSVHFYI
jgi:hypothetical protein